MKSDGVKDVFKWLDKKCKEQKKAVETAKANYEAAKKTYYFEDEQCLIDLAKMDLECAKERLNAFVEIKIGVEKYMRKLRHQGQ